MNVTRASVENPVGLVHVPDAVNCWKLPPIPTGAGMRSSVIMALVIAVDAVVRAIWATGIDPAGTDGATEVPATTEMIPE
jgi:hypothetical protein